MCKVRTEGALTTTVKLNPAQCDDWLMVCLFAVLIKADDLFNQETPASCQDAR